MYLILLTIALVETMHISTSFFPNCWIFPMHNGRKQCDGGSLILSNKNFVIKFVIRVHFGVKI